MRPPRAHAARGASTRLLQHTQSRGMVAVLNMIGDGAIVHFQELGEEEQLVVAAVAGNELEGSASVQLVLCREAGDPVSRRLACRDGLLAVPNLVISQERSEFLK